MVNYESRFNDANKQIGGAIEMLSQYDANNAGDEYSAKNKANVPLLPQYDLSSGEKQSLNDLHTLMKGGRLNIGKVLHKVLELTPKVIHTIKKVAEGVHKFRKGVATGLNQSGGSLVGGSHIGGILSGMTYHDGALRDIAGVLSANHLAHMLDKDHKIMGGSMVGGSFWDTLGDIAKTVAPFAPLLL